MNLRDKFNARSREVAAMRTKVGIGLVDLQRITAQLAPSSVGRVLKESCKKMLSLYIFLKVQYSPRSGGSTRFKPGVFFSQAVQTSAAGNSPVPAPMKNDFELCLCTEERAQLALTHMQARQ